MRLHRLELIEIKGVVERTLQFPDRGVVIVEGPNEVGKTTMIEALDLLLDEKDSSRKRHVLAIRPVGRDVASMVEAELSSGPYRFTYRKRWFRQPGTELTVTHPRREHLTGVDAHERVLAILAETADLVLWRALRLMQAAPLVQADLAGSSALAAALDAAALTLDRGPGPTSGAVTEGTWGGRGAEPGPGEPGAPEAGASARAATGASVGSATGFPDTGTQVADPETGTDADKDADKDADTIVAAAEAEYRTYFTAGQGQPTGAYRAARERFVAADAAVRQTAVEVTEVQDDVDRHAAVTAQAITLETELAAARAAVEDLDTQWAQVEALIEASATAERQLGIAERDAQRTRDRWEERRTRAKALADGESALAEQADQAQDVAQRLAPQERDLAELAARQRRAEATVQAARRTRDEAAAREARRRDANDLVALEARLRRLADLARERTAALADLEPIRVDAAALAEIERAAAQVDIARAALTAGSARVTLTALDGPEQVVLEGESVSVAAGEPLERVVVEPLTVVVPDRLAVTVTPEAGAHVRAEAVRQAREELERLLDAAGAADLDTARALQDQAQQARAVVRRADEGRRDILGADHEDELVLRAAVLRESLARAATPRGGTADETDAADTTDETETETDQTDEGGGRPDSPRESVSFEVADARLAEQADLAHDLSVRLHARREAVDLLRLEVARTASLVAAVRGQLEAERARLDASRAVEPDDALRAAAEDAQGDVAAARAARSAATAALAAHDPSALRVRVDAARAALPALRERRADLRDERIAIEARLEAAGGQGRQERLDAALSEQAHARAEFEAVDRRARAARLLYDTLQRRRTEAKRAYVAPYAKELTRFGRVVYGPDFEVEVADDLAITGRILNGRRIDFDALSTGAKEQLAILTRLACASLVDPAHGVPVIIDDALGYSDPERLRRICAAFSMRGPDAQLILLTCTPGRYAGIPGAALIRL